MNESTQTQAPVAVLPEWNGEVWPGLGTPPLPHPKVGVS